MSNHHWSPDLMCEVCSVFYNFEQRAGRLSLPINNSTDMSGAIKFIRKIDPEVQQIEVYAGGVLDGAYVLDGESNLTRDSKIRGWTARGGGKK